MRLENGEVLLGWPLERPSLTAGNYYQDGSWHGAIDLAAKVGSPVLAAEDGTVEWVQQWDGVTKSGSSAQTYGNAVRIRHQSYSGASLQTLYAHLDRLLVHNGQKVRAGQQIALSGNTGASTGPHLHFEVRWGGKRYNPLCWLDDNFYSTPGWKPYLFGPNEHSAFAPPADELNLHGVDVSKYQGEVDWERVKPAVDFAFVRAVSTHANGKIYEDPFFQRNFAECKRLGIPVGVYYYTYAANRPTVFAECAMLKKALNGRSCEWPVVVDVEENKLRHLEKDELTELVLMACREIKSWGYTPMVYSGRNYSINELDLHAIRQAGVDVWCADYTGNRPKVRHTIWQYSSKGEIPGINGPCDVNTAYKNYESEGQEMTFEPVTNLELVAMPGKHACEIFSEPDVNKPIGKLPKEQVLEITGKGETITIADMEGTWFKVLYFGKPAYVLALPDRCEVRAAVEPEKPAEKPSVPAEGDITISGANAWQKHALLALAGKWGLTVQ